MLGVILWAVPAILKGETMSLRSQYQTDTKKENDGVEVKLPANEDGTVPTFVVSRMGKANKAYMKALEVAMRPFQRRKIDNDTAGEILEVIFVKHVLKGWSNVKLADVTGNPQDKGDATCNEANAKLLFAALPDLFDELNTQASDASNFRDVELEDNAGNS